MKLRGIHPVKIWRAINWQAALVLMLFLLNWSAAPVSLFVTEPDVCAMECCVAEGHCCCATKKLWVEGQNHGGIREIGTAGLETACPCPATPPSGVKTLSRQTVRLISHDLANESADQPILFYLPDLYDSLRFTPRSPRAPPSFS